jgi:hypothetical protein
MAPSRHNHQLVKVLQEFFGISFLVPKSFAFCPANLALHGIPVKPFENSLLRRTEIQTVKIIPAAESEASVVVKSVPNRSQFEISPAVFLDSLRQICGKGIQFFGAAEQWLAMIGERN